MSTHSLFICLTQCEVEEIYISWRHATSYQHYPVHVFQRWINIEIRDVMSLSITTSLARLSITIVCWIKWGVYNVVEFALFTFSMLVCLSVTAVLSKCLVWAYLDARFSLRVWYLFFKQGTIGYEAWMLPIPPKRVDKEGASLAVHLFNLLTRNYSKFSHTISDLFRPILHTFIRPVA